MRGPTWKSTQYNLWCSASFFSIAIFHYAKKYSSLSILLITTLRPPLIGGYNVNLWLSYTYYIVNIYQHHLSLILLHLRYIILGYNIQQFLKESHL